MILRCRVIRGTIIDTAFLIVANHRQISVSAIAILGGSGYHDFAIPLNSDAISDIGLASLIHIGDNDPPTKFGIEAALAVIAHHGKIRIRRSVVCTSHDHYRTIGLDCQTMSCIILCLLVNVSHDNAVRLRTEIRVYNALIRVTQNEEIRVITIGGGSYNNNPLTVVIHCYSAYSVLESGAYIFNRDAIRAEGRIKGSIIAISCYGHGAVADSSHDDAPVRLKRYRSSLIVRVLPGAHVCEANTSIPKGWINRAVLVIPHQSKIVIISGIRHRISDYHDSAVALCNIVGCNIRIMAVFEIREVGPKDCSRRCRSSPGAQSKKEKNEKKEFVATGCIAFHNRGLF